MAEISLPPPNQINATSRKTYESCSANLGMSTSELQPAALLLYEANGYKHVANVVATDPSNKPIGGGVQRYYFEKNL